MKNIFYSVFVFIYILQSVMTAQVTIIKGKEFYQQVAQEYVNEWEEYGLCNFLLDDFTQNITKSDYFGYTVDGTVYYTNGYIGTLQEVDFTIGTSPHDGHINDDKAYFDIKITMSSLMIYYDFFANITDGPFSGTVAIPHKEMRKVLWVTKYFKNNTEVHEVDVISSSPIKKWLYEPSNHYTDIINEDIRYDFWDNFQVLGKNQWNMLLGNVLKRVPFPEFCLFC